LVIFMAIFLFSLFGKMGDILTELTNSTCLQQYQNKFVPLKLLPLSHAFSRKPNFSASYMKFLA